MIQIVSNESNIRKDPDPYRFDVSMAYSGDRLHRLVFFAIFASLRETLAQWYVPRSWI
jgi:hypothetical protein